MTVEPLSASAQPARAEVAASGEGAALTLLGDWRMRAGLPTAEEILKRLQAAGPGRQIRLKADDILWDSALLLILRRLRREAAEAGYAMDVSGLPEGVRRLMALAEREEPAGARRDAGNPSFFGDVGEAALKGFREGGQMLAFTGETALAFWRLLRGRPGFRGSDLLLIIQDVGVKALPIVTLISILVGMILAFVGAVQLRQFGVEIYVANLVGIAMLREMGALMTAIIMAGRTGAAFAAELASMQANEEVDALNTFGFNSVDFLVLPRVIALVLMMPLLALYADILGILGGALIGTTLLGLDFSQYWAQTMRAINLTQLFIGLAKACVFGVIVALTGCQRGLVAGRSAAAVGLATTSAVVIAIVLIVVADGLFAVILDILKL